MLTPGIEYFAASNDDDAVAFAEGRHTREIRLVRADGVAPGGILAAFGSLLTGRSMDELSDPSHLRVVSSDERDEFSIILAAVPDDVVVSLAAADEARLSEVARRSGVFTELAGIPPERIAVFLADLADLTRTGGGHLYARILVPRDWAPPSSPWWRRLGHLAPWAGVAMASLLVVLAIVLLPTGSRSAVLPAAGVLGAFSIGALIARHVSARATRVAGVRGGIVLLWVADRPIRTSLHAAASSVLDSRPLPMGRRVPGRWGHLAVDPSGVTVYAGNDEPVSFPASTVVAVSPATVRAGSGGFGLKAPTPGVAFEFGTPDGRAASWIAPLVTTAGQALHPAQAGAVVSEIQALLGLDPDRSGDAIVV